MAPPIERNDRNDRNDRNGRNDRADGHDGQDRERIKAVELAVVQIEKQFGKGSIMRLGQKGAIQPIDTIPTAPSASTSPLASAACLAAA